MGYFDDKKNVEDYVKMASGYDGQALIDLLSKYLPKASTVLELGMGPGVDLLMLSQLYQATGSDSSEVFIECFRNEHPTADLVRLDAVEMDIDRTFDCIYSNKVLHHLSTQELKTSLQQQARILNSNGITLHSFWHGDKEETHHGLRFVYYTEESLRELVGPEYEIVDIQTYQEMSADDSLYLLLRKNA